MSDFRREYGLLADENAPTGNVARTAGLWRDDDDFHRTIQSKLTGLLDTPQFLNFSRCGREEIFRKCRDCRTLEKIQWRCNLKWCPRCQWRLAQMRKDFIFEYARNLEQPKHLVLTSKNFEVMTRKKLRENLVAMAELRRRVSFAQVKGGCASVEVTWAERGAFNNGIEVAGGFHLHSHWLIEARWIDLKAVEADWAELIGQKMAVIRVYDARDQDYLQELCKYVVEGSELAKWPAEIILQFVTAARGVRFFFTFGNLRKMAAMLRDRIETKTSRDNLCTCGCDQFKYRLHESPETEEDRFKFKKRRRGILDSERSILRAKYASRKKLKSFRFLDLEA